ncbi:MAG: MerR family transcriptional regulator [Solirubrobacterales bacterium]
MEAATEDSRTKAELTIDELARHIGMSVRNIREHQARGLLQPPEVRARIGYYGPDHLERLKLIVELQAEGFNLKGIKRLIEDAHGVTDRLAAVRRAVIEPFETEQPQVFTRDELQERFGAENADAAERAVKLGALVPLGDGSFEAPSPSLLDAAEEVVSRGVPLSTALAVLGQMEHSSKEVARSFVRLFIDAVWKPFTDAGYPEERWPEVLESIEQLRPIASRALLATFQQTMTREVQDAFGKELSRYGRRK